MKRKLLSFLLIACALACPAASALAQTAVRLGTQTQGTLPNGSAPITMATQSCVQSQCYSFGVGAGTANAQLVTLSPVPSAYVAGMMVSWLPAAANTTTTPTVNVNSLGVKTIIKAGGAALAASDLTTTAIAQVIYDGTSFELQNPQTTSGGGAVSSVFGRTGTVAATSGDYTCAEVTGCGGAPDANRFYIVATSCGTLSSTRCIVLNNNDSTNNCGTPFTNLVAAFNSYVGSGYPILDFEDGSGGKFKFTNCNLVVEVNSTILLNAYIDATNSGDNWLQIGEPGCTAYNTGCTSLNVSVTSTTYLGGGFTGGASETTALIHSEPWMGLVNISNLFLLDTGAHGATPGACTNYTVQFDTSSQPTMTDTFAYMDNPGTCLVNNGNSVAGQGTLLAHGNIWDSGGGCGSQGLIEGGTHSTFVGNSVYNFAIPIRLQGAGTQVVSNNLDTGPSCTANGVSADIHIGAVGSSAVVSDFTITGNDIVGSHVSYLLALAGNTSATTVGTSTVTANVADNGTPTSVTNANCNGSATCQQVGNANIPNSGATGWIVGQGTFGSINTPAVYFIPKTVAGLPSATGLGGLVESVADSTTVTVEGQTCVGGGSTSALAFSNGTVWKCF